MGLALGSVALALAAPASAQEAAHDDRPIVTADNTDLARLSIEQLANLEVTSVSRRAEPLSSAPAAIYVITREDIRRAGARSLPEALRLAPNLEVARIDSSSYAITSRGFNHSTGTANKLLVLIDGRAVYTPLYAGVFWDAQNVLLEDVDRIEVISGPGGTLWGANAVNGVINIITRPASETQGAFASAAGGTHNAALSARFGGSVGREGAFRVYGMGLRRGPSETATGADANDQWDNLQAGFRADWSAPHDDITLQGDLYQGRGEDVPGEVRHTISNGGNVLGRWSRRFNDDSALQVQAYYDNQRRAISSGILTTIETVDLEGQYDFALGARHHIIVGGGVRESSDHFDRGPGTSFLDPAERRLRLGQAFAQDTYALTRTIDLTVGVKLEHNSYTGMEVMPNARLAWSVNDETLVWAAVSRAVRTPSRFDTDLINPGLIAGGPDFDSERLTAYELGLRMQPSANLTFSASAFYNDYDDLRTLEATPVTVFPLTISNRMRGETYGLEVWGDYALAPWWRLSVGAAFLRKDLELEPGSADFFGVAFAGNDPDYQASVHSLMNLSHGVQLDLGVRAVDALPSPRVPAYAALDARLGWQVSDHVEVALSGYNLADDTHPEFASAGLPVRQIPRSLLLTLNWRP